MKLDWAHWLYGLVSGFIGGGASAVTSGLTAIGIDPEHFNLGSSPHGLRHVGALIGATFLVSGGISAFAYLKQSPLPPPEAK